MINYESFNKNFYKETTAIAKMTDAEVKLYRAVELDGVRIRGKNCPKPVKNWAQTGVSFKVLSVLKGKLLQKMSEKRQKILNKITEHFTLKISEKFGLSNKQIVIGYIYIGTPKGKKKSLPKMNTDDYISVWG